MDDGHVSAVSLHSLPIVNVPLIGTTQDDVCVIDLESKVRRTLPLLTGERLDTTLRHD